MAAGGSECYSEKAQAFGAERSSGMPREPALNMPPPPWLLGQGQMPGKPCWSPKPDYGLPAPREAYDAHVVATCEAKPTLARNVDGTFVMELRGVTVGLSTTCDPQPSPMAGSTIFRPCADFFVALPEVRHVVFDPFASTPAGLSAAATVHKSITVLEVPTSHDLNAKIRTNSPSGSLSLQDVRYTGSYKEVVAETVLNYELRANGRISISQHGGAHQLNVEFDFDFQCWLTGTVMNSTSDAQRSYEAPLVNRGTESIERPLTPPSNDLATSAANSKAVPCTVQAEVKPEFKRNAYSPSSLRLSFSSEEVIRALDNTNDQLLQIERRVEEIVSVLPKTSARDVCPLKTELTRLETKAKSLETKGVDDVYTGELRSGKKIAKDAKKDMLCRFEQVFGRFEEAFATMRTMNA